MHRMSMAWYYGKVDMDEGTAYDSGINYQCPINFAYNFRIVSQQLSTSIQSIRTDIQIKFQPKIQLSLNYLCCFLH
jgi:hypothetical protein